MIENNINNTGGSEDDDRYEERREDRRGKRRGERIRITDEENESVNN